MRDKIQSILNQQDVKDIEAKINEASREVALLTQQKRQLLSQAVNATGIIGRRVKFSVYVYEVVDFRDVLFGEIQLMGRKVKKDGTLGIPIVLIPPSWELID